MNDTRFESCIKCTVCTTTCPVSRVNPRYPGPKQAGPDGERLRLKDGALYDEAWMLATAGVPHCKRCGGVVKPDVVLYEEPLGEGDVRAAVEAISASDLLIIGGTSLVVYPAAGLVRYFRGDAIIIVNLQPTPQDAGADVVCACDIASAFDW